MSDTPDSELLQQFARNQSESAFSELVERHLGLVYSMAFRKTANPQHAQDITQAVFIILARKAGSLGPKTVLPGWLYHTARLTAANFQRGEMRRLRREQEAYMQSTTDESAPDALWRELSPLLEDAMAGLGARDRDAIVLRFFQNRNFAEVGVALGAGEDAAKMRVHRALEKLRKFFSKRGIVSTTAIIAGAISANSVQAAPEGLAHVVSAVAVAKGTAASISTVALMKGGLKALAWAKAKTIITASVAALFIGGASIVSIEVMHALRQEFAPDIQGTWEGVVDVEDNGVGDGQDAQARFVLRLFKTNGVYRATTDNPDWGIKDTPTVDVVYDYPNLIIHPTIRDTWTLKVDADATEMYWDRYIRFIQPDPVVLTRTTTPTPVPEPLTESDFAPRPGSALQGYWEGEIGTNHVPVDLKISDEADGTFRAEGDRPMQGIQGRPINVSYKPPAVEFTPADGAGTFSGQINDSDTEISGAWTQGGQSESESLRRVDYHAEHAHDADKDYSFESTNDLQGHWKGAWTVTIGHTTVQIREALDIAKLPDGSYSPTMSSVDTGGVDAPIPPSVFKYSPPDIHMEWPLMGWVYDGKLEDGKIDGTWSQGGGGFSLVFERTND